MVPGNYGLISAVYAAIAIDAPSRAARNAIARPIPRDPPVINSRFPDRLISSLALPRSPSEPPELHVIGAPR